MNLENLYMFCCSRSHETKKVSGKENEKKRNIMVSASVPHGPTPQGQNMLRHLSVSIHAYIHTCIHTYIRTYVHTYTYIRIHTYIHTSIHFLFRDFMGDVQFWCRAVYIRSRQGIRPPVFNLGLLSHGKPCLPWTPKVRVPECSGCHSG